MNAHESDGFTNMKPLRIIINTSHKPRRKNIEQKIQHIQTMCCPHLKRHVSLQLQAHSKLPQLMMFIFDNNITHLHDNVLVTEHQGVYSSRKTQGQVAHTSM